MDFSALSWHYGLLAFMVLFWFVWRRTTGERHSLPLPPGPPGWPIVGNLFQLGRRPHESTYKLSLKYGPLICLRLGMKTTVVVSSPAMAKEFLKTNDSVFAGRPVLESAKPFSREEASIVWGGYGDYWRHLRRLSAVELFSPKRLGALQHLRRDQVFRTLRLIFEEEEGKAVGVGTMVFCTTLNLLGNMIFSTNVYDPHNPDSAGLKETVCELIKLGASPNLADFFPFLGFLDPQGVAREMSRHLTALYEFSDVYIQERLDATGKTGERKDSEKDFLDVLLDSRNKDFGLANIRVFIAELLIAGSDSSTTTVEWAMAEFIRNPERLKRLREELDEVVGCNRKVEESDLDNLPYLHAAVKETFRLHPSGALLLPRKAGRSCEIGGFVIPKDSQLMVNVWAMGRDPSVWESPLEFVPERFLEGENSKIEYGGQHFELIPFGAGRRICPGIPLASRMVRFVLASLLHSFEWILPDGMSCEQMDMSDQFGVSLKKSQGLNAIPIPRLPHHIY